MTDYKSIYFTVDFEIGDKALTIANDYLSKQPEPHPFIESNSAGYIFNFHTLDIKLLKRNIQALSEKDDIFSGDISDPKKVGEVLQVIYDEVSKVGSYGIKSGKRQYVDFNIERKVQNRKSKKKNCSQYYYAQDNGFSEVNNELPEKFVNQIVRGDSLEVLKSFPDNSIDLVFTSPPYNFGLEYDNQDDAHLWDNYFQKLFLIFDECIRVVKFGGRIVVNIQPLFSDYIPSHHIISNHFIGRKMIWKGEILWEKNNYNCKYTAWGSWKSPSNPYLKYTWEFVEIFSKGSLKKSGESENADITLDEFKEWVVAKWSIAPERKMKEFGHPAMFPEKLAERVIKLFPFKGDVVLDPFNGVGTTTAVAKRLGRKYIGIDISQEYCDVANKRLKSTLFQKDMVMPHNIAEIQKAYNILVGGIDEKAHTDDEEGGRAYGGAVRSAKGILVESIAKNLVEIAWKELKGDPERLTFTRETIKIPLRPSYLKRVRPQEVADYIKAHIEQYFYGHKTDVHVNIDEKFVLGIECKAYTENAMLKRILVDFTLLKQATPKLKCVLLQLESQLTGDYSKPLNPVIYGSASSHTLMSYFDIDLTIITLLEGERKVDESIHKRKHFKEMTESALKKAVQTLKDLLVEFL